jgi:hypothetical protein
MSTELAAQPEEDYPGVEQAYPFAVASYELAQKRLDIIDSRLQTIVALGVTLSLPVPALLATRGANFRSWWFIGAACVFVCAIAVGTFARIVGHITVLHPSDFYAKWLRFPEWEFKKNLIFFAGQHFEKNRTLARNRGLCTTLTFLLFILEGVLLAVWATTLPRP